MPGHGLGAARLGQPGVLGVELGELGQHGLPVRGRLRRRTAGSKAERSTVTGSHEQFLRDVGEPGAQQLTEGLGLRVEPRVVGDALAEQAAHDHVDRAQVGQDVPFQFQAGGLGQQRAHPLQR